MGRRRLPRRNCLNCGAVVDRLEKRYCGFRCQRELQYRRNVEAWLAGRVPGGGGRWALVANFVRRYLFERQASCWVCGWAEVHPVTRRIPLHVDHIDGDWSNNQPDNLRLLCPNCHALTAS
jgi:HNH endonuclease